MTQNTSDETLLPYKKVGEELSIVNDLVLRGTRIIVPLELQKKMVKLAHEGHQGLVKSKKLLRAKVWFPGMDKLVERDVKGVGGGKILSLLFPSFLHML